MFAENPDVFLKDFGVTVELSSSCCCKGIFDQPDEGFQMGGRNVLSTSYQVTVKTSDVQAAGTASGSAITVDGVAYTVRDVLQEDDGVFCKLTLTRT
jgi:hypothetical protein